MGTRSFSGGVGIGGVRGQAVGGDASGWSVTLEQLVDARAEGGSDDRRDQIHGEVAVDPGQQGGAELAGRVCRAATERTEYADDHRCGSGETEREPAAAGGIGEEEADQ